ncbi:plasmid replication protein, CyRepA1 family [Gloeothece verrucosa]|uniref:Replication origin-binding protein domain-containing protein n=1 Tax=Gloeothece verrucosa (strain PCC 7822) TaxID=497965 RepID=E0UD31_GLOV7|nr:plasmid replication protein, CyRepA1 family [Gloeothece verrucosa]ADN12911.1 hypothetical protein Cyan7822_0896 [Gloeothece verrucosa PCC 7822]
MSWKRFYKRDCPVCGGTRNDCRQNTITELVHCRELDAAPGDYVFRGFDGLGFGMWTDKASAEAWTEEKRREWQEMRRQQRERKQIRLSRLLTDAERDIAIHSILSQLELSEEHRHQLQERGMTDEQIEAGLYRSVKQWQQLETEVDDNLAGVLRGGKKLYVPVSGILCPIANEQGQLVGWQIRLDNSLDEFPKYLWASSEKKRRNDGPSVHLKNGELPLAFFAPSTEPHEVISKWFKKQKEDKTIIPVALTEGVAFKPSITCERLGIYTIGASGGNFASSPETLKTYLESIKEQIEAQREESNSNLNNIALQPILFADAGCLVNENIIKIYSNTIGYLETLGFEAKIAWWGQRDKDNGDIDEIDGETLASIRLLSTQEFFSLVKKTQRDLKVKAVQRQLQSLTYEPNIRLRSRYLPDLAALIPKEGIVALKSPKGTGKSVQIQKIIESCQNGGMKIISLTPRRALGREQSLKWGITWGGDQISGLDRVTLLENMESLGICWDSVWKLLERDWSHSLVIIDESELALIHLLLSSTCKDKRPLILRVLENKIRESLANGGMLLIADADMSDLSINYFKALVPEAPVFVVTNEYVGKETQWSIEFHTGKKDTAIAQLIADLARPVIDNGVERQRKIAIPTDSQDQAEALERFIRECYPHLIVVRIDSSTTETDEGRSFVERPNDKLLEIKPDVLIYTSSMGAGVSIDMSWFDLMYAFFTGVLEPSQCRQMLSRVRENIPRIIWCRSRGKVEGNNSFLPEEIKEHLFTFHRETSILIDVAKAIAPDNPTDWQIRQAYDAIWNPQTQTWDNPHVNLYCSLIARKNYGLANLAAELHRQLIEEGHIIINSRGNDKTDEGSRVADIKKQLPKEEAEAISEAEDIPLDMALLMSQKNNPTKEQSHQIAKALLKAELPGIELTKEFIYKATTKDRRKWLNAQKLFWYSQNPDKTKILDLREWLDHLWQFVNGAVYLPDIRTYSFQIKVLQDIGLFESIDLKNPDKEYSGDDEGIQEVLRLARKFSRSINTAFNFKVTLQTKPIQFINRLLNRVGLHLKFERQVKGRQRFYRLALDKFNDPDRIAVLDSLNRKWEQLGSESDSWASQRKPVEINNTDESCDPQNLCLVNNIHESVEATGEISAQKTLTSKPIQAASESDSWGSQHSPINNNNNGDCCDARPFSMTNNIDETVKGIKEISVEKTPSPKAVQLSSGSNSWGSQHSLINNNNRGECCEAQPLSLDNNINETVEATGTIAEQETFSPKRVQAVSESDSWGSQHSLTINNNNGECCDAQTEPATFTEDFPRVHIPEEYREGVLEIEQWLSDTVTDTPENFKGMLNVAIEYLRLIPKARKWLWEQMTREVKVTIWQLFPDYYQLLAR